MKTLLLFILALISCGTANATNAALRCQTDVLTFTATGCMQLYYLTTSASVSEDSLATGYTIDLDKFSVGRIVQKNLGATATINGFDIFSFSGTHNVIVSDQCKSTGDHYQFYLNYMTTDALVIPTATPTATPCATVTRTTTATATPSVTRTATPSTTPTATPTATPSVTRTPTPSVTPSVTKSGTRTNTPTVTPTFTFTATPTPTP